MLYKDDASELKHFNENVQINGVCVRECVVFILQQTEKEMKGYARNSELVIQIIPEPRKMTSELNKTIHCTQIKRNKNNIYL